MKRGNCGLRIANCGFSQPARHSPLAPAFTLIELMVVIGIIGILITIAVPAYSKIRQSAAKTATAATISAINLGVEGYRTDAKLGGQYPPSVHVNAISPHDDAAHFVDGANLIVWALAGADLLGTPGFRNVDATNADEYGGWLNDIGKSTTKNGSGPPQPALYNVGAGGTPAYTRYGPFVDLSKVKLTKQTTPGTASFDIPDATLKLNSLAFLDNFGIPILYYKANVGVQQWIDCGDFATGSGDETAYRVSGGPSSQYIPSGIYNLLDNSLITGHSTSQGLDFGAGTNHFQPSPSTDKLGAISHGNYISGVTPTPPKGSFGYTVWNPNVTATPKPHRDDSFILLSAGPDGLFGTGDDIGNFPIND
jgi:prepilin-type N-terminal cleavage/methylation domain-containing protein